MVFGREGRGFEFSHRPATSPLGNLLYTAASFQKKNNVNFCLINKTNECEIFCLNLSQVRISCHTHTHSWAAKFHCDLIFILIHVELLPFGKLFFLSLLIILKKKQDYS